MSRYCGKFSKVVPAVKAKCHSSSSSSASKSSCSSSSAGGKCGSYKPVDPGTKTF